MKKYILIFISLFSSLGFSQNDGSLDTSFGSGGIVINDAFTSTGADLTILSDGKILVAGYLNSITLRRYNPDGTPDTTFNPVNTGVFGGVSSMVLQPDQKVLVAGLSTSLTGFIIRFNQDGTLDTNFGVGGIVNTSFYNITKIKLNSTTNKLIIGAVTRVGTNNYFSIARYNSNGSIDTTFNNNGVLTFPTAYSFPKISDIKFDSSNRIVACGSYHFDSNLYSSFATDNFLCRVNNDGTLDNSFSDDGILIVDKGTYNSEKFNESNAIILKSNGSILIAGTKGTDPSSGRNFALYEVNSNGILTSPNMPLQFNVVNNKSDIASCMAVDNFGKIVLAGKSGNGSLQNSFSLLRLNSDYTVDATFGTNGVVTTFSELNNNRLYNIAIQPDNKIVAVGTIKLGSNASFEDKMCLVRYIGTTALGNPQFDTNEFQIYPNPVSTKLNLQMTSFSSENNNYEISNINGRIMIKGTIEQENTVIDLENLSKGIYIIKTSNNSIPKKIIKE